MSRSPNNLRRWKELKAVDPRQVEKFLASPGIAEDVGPEVAQQWGEHASKERFKTDWTSKGNTILPSGDFVKGEEYRGLPTDERKMLMRMGVGKFNTFKEENVKLETGEWYLRSEFGELDEVEKGKAFNEGTSGLEAFRAGNTKLDTGDWISKEHYGALPESHKGLLNNLGIGGYNEFIASNIQLSSEEWYPTSKWDKLKDWEKGTLQDMGSYEFNKFRQSSESKVYEAVVDGYKTYSELEQVTGLTRSQIDSSIEGLKKKGLLT